MTRPGPFQSKLIPHVDQILRWRREGKTWKDVAGALAELGCKSDPGSLCRFIGRWERKPYPIGATPEAALKPARPAVKAKTPKAKKLGDDYRRALQEDRPKTLFDKTKTIE